MNTHLKHLFALAWSSPGVWRLFSPAPPLARTVPSAPTAHGKPGRQHGAALRHWAWAVGVVVGLAVVAVVMGSALVSARIMIEDGGDGEGGGGDGGGDDGGGGIYNCLDHTIAEFSADRDAVVVGEFVTFYWQVVPSSGCGAMTQHISTIGPVARSGSQMVQILTLQPWILSGRNGNESRPLVTAALTVTLPPTVTITSDDQVAVFVQAIGTIGQRIEIQNHVELNLSHRSNLAIEPGVQIIGGRSPTDPGPRLFTTTFPASLFLIGTGYEHIYSDNVRISGVRLEGAEMGVADDHTPASVGITVYSSVNVEIDNNELYGWSNAAVGVEDPFNQINPDNPNAVWVHDNFIHHNQHRGRLGYGVVVGETAYALIERNVFDWNRHAIAGNGSDGSGYRAYRNLVLENGGYHDTYNACDIPWWLALVSQTATAAQALCVLGIGPSYTHYTHQFDMHGQGNCGLSGTFSDTVFNCGTAGHDMDIRDNAFVYTKGDAIRLRGTPQIGPHGALVIANVFAHDDLDEAVTQTETGLLLSGNLTGVNGMHERSVGVCDFNGDGVNDDFLATGVTWWYRSGVLGAGSPWRYLSTSPKRRSHLRLGYFSGDGICDVKDDTGLVYLGGVTPDLSLPVVPNVRELRVDAASSVLAAAGFTTGPVDYFSDTNCAYLNSTVASQSPAADTYAPAGTPVTLRVALKPTACK